MFRLISDIMLIIAVLALAGFSAHHGHMVIRGLIRHRSLRFMLSYFGSCALLILLWIAILGAYFFPEQKDIQLLALFAGIFNLTLFLGLMYSVVRNVIGKANKVYFKNGETKIYPPQYSSDNVNYYFERVKGRRDAVKKEYVEKIELVTYQSVIGDSVKLFNTGNRRTRSSLVKAFFLKYEIVIISGIFIIVIVTFLI